MTGFYITINNGLLKNGHKRRMGSAVWEFMWFLDHMTSINEKGVGKVLGGKPVKYEEVNNDLEIPLRDYRRHVERLRANGYISTKRTPYGLIIYVNKAKKVFNQRSAENGTLEVPKMAHQSDKNGTSNKTRQLDKTIDNTEFLKKFLSYWNELFNTSYKTIEPLEENASYWLKHYTPEQMNEAASKIKDSDYWNGKMTPVIFFRRMNPRKEKVDYIGEMLNVKKKNGLSENYRIIKA